LENGTAANLGIWPLPGVFAGRMCHIPLGEPQTPTIISQVCRGGMYRIKEKNEFFVALQVKIRQLFDIV
jgi:hypothetical protein